MSERKREKKIRSIFRRIVRWISLGLLTILLILALVFQTPWKIITLLLIFLAACTVLAKRIWKWFWLGVGAVVIASIVWIFLPEDNEGWRPYTFDEELAALEAKYAIPSEENASDLYNGLFENYSKDAFYNHLSINEQAKIPMREPWLSKDHPHIAQWLQQHQLTIKMLLKASEFEKCHFQISLDSGPNSQWIRRLSAIRHWAFLLASSASNDLAGNRFDEALRKYIAILQIGGHQCQQPGTLNALAGIAIEGLAINQINRFVVTNETTEEHLKIIEKSLAKIQHNWSSDFSRMLDSNTLISKRSLGCFYEINSKGKIRLNRDPMAEWMTSWKEHYEKKQMEEQEIKAKIFPRPYEYLTYWQKKTIRVQTLLRWFLLPSNPKKAGKVIDAIYESHYALAQPDFDWQKGVKEVSELVLPTVSKWPSLSQRRTIEHLADLSSQLNSYHRLHDMYLRHLSNHKGCRILIALRRYKNEHGHWPQTLDGIQSRVTKDALIDPQNKGPFVYKLSDDSFILYSKGKNNLDEGLQMNDGADDWPIWLPKE